MEELRRFFSHTFFTGSEYEFSVANLVVSFSIFIFAFIFKWFIVRVVLKKYYDRKNIDVGSRFAFNQILKYIIFLFATLIALQSLGIKLTVLLGGLAALVVGIGLGLQQTFNDFASGIILLFDRSIEVGDVVDVDGEIGHVERIGIRTSQIRTRNNAMIILPNSKVVVDKVVNWTFNDALVKFIVNVGVAYGTDTAIVRDLMKKVAIEHPKVLDKPPPFVRFKNFGDSSLDFELHFWSNESMGIDDVKSDLRFATDKIFRENKIQIPFPQRDIWIKKEG